MADIGMRSNWFPGSQRTADEDPEGGEAALQQAGRQKGDTGVQHRILPAVRHGAVVVPPCSKRRQAVVAASKYQAARQHNFTQ